ncbi:MAG: arginine--tRNA ligase [Lachnospiraceae bacterium]|nr:arginine--tRNA ligase [Lachnospiraceae bacterium]
MQKLIDLISEKVSAAFEAAGFDPAMGQAVLSNRPDLCEYQCNGAMALAKTLHRPPFEISDAVAAKLVETDSETFAAVQSVKPGFLNLTLQPEFVRGYLVKMLHEKKFGLQQPAHAAKIILDYGGPNVAKPLHVGHLRPAIIGEAVKRILRYAGNDVTGDIHMGDWGLQMGLVITELKLRRPELPYFDENYTGAYPKEAPFTLQELAEMYPTASAKTKTDENASDEEKAAAAAYKAEALEATKKMQDGDRGYRAIWRHIMNLSLPDLRRNYDHLHVDFDLWRGESDVHDVIPGMVEYFRQNGFAHESQGALVIDVTREDDAKELPPCIVLKSDGAALYATTDLATIQERVKEFRPDAIFYFTDKRQALHFEQVFRAARRSKLVLPETELRFIGNGTMNGADGKPFKTRAGGVMPLADLVADTEKEMYTRIRESNPDMPKEEAQKTAAQVALAAIKYGDLSNQPAKDYIFDMEKFTSFEGDTGPYILYTIVRIKSILKKYEEQGGSVKDALLSAPGTHAEKVLGLQLTRFADAVESAVRELAPNRICAYIYETANAFNSFYHETKILVEPDESKKQSYIALIAMTKRILETGIDLLGFDAPEKM